MYASGRVTETVTGRGTAQQATTITQLSLSVGGKHRINMSTSSTNLNYTYPTWPHKVPGRQHNTAKSR